MKALLLAAGLGTRLRPLTDTIPKCMVPIHGRPLLDYWLQLLTDAGVNEIAVNTSYLPDVVRDYVAQSPFRDAVRLVHEDALLGTAGTVRNNAEWLRSDAPFFVAHADNLTRFSMEHFTAAHNARPNGCDITMMTFETDHPQSCGIVELDAEGRVVAFHEKQPNPPCNLANAAVFIMQPSVLDMLDKMGADPIDISVDVLPHYLGKMSVWTNRDYHRDIGTLESLQKAEQEFNVRGVA